MHSTSFRAVKMRTKYTICSLIVICFTTAVISVWNILVLFLTFSLSSSFRYEFIHTCYFITVSRHSRGPVLQRCLQNVSFSLRIRRYGLALLTYTQNITSPSRCQRFECVIMRYLQSTKFFFKGETLVLISFKILLPSLQTAV